MTFTGNIYSIYLPSSKYNEKLDFTISLVSRTVSEANKQRQPPHKQFPNSSTIKFYMYYKL